MWSISTSRPLVLHHVLWDFEDSQMTVLGFDSAKYDANLVKLYLSTHLGMADLRGQNEE